MNLPTPAGLIKFTLATVWALTFSGCGAAVATAPFRERPGSVLYGDLRGSFDGQVIDGGTGKPLSGATVIASWAWVSGVGAESPSGASSMRLATDSDGRYKIPRLVTDGDGRLDRFTLVIYKRGYVGFRSDRRWEDSGVRADFVQHGAKVTLQPFPPTASHVKHLRYLGAGGPLLADLGWEIQQASEELEGARAETAPTVPEELALDATPLLSPDELKAVTGYKGEFAVEKLGDLPTTANYDSIHFKAVDQPETFDAALRVFKAAPADAEKQYEKVLAEYPSVEEKNEVGDRSLRAHEGDLLAIVAFDRAHGDVVVFTCGKDQCHDEDTMAALMKRMWPRLDRVVAKKAPEEKPTSHKPGEEFKLRAPELK